MDAVGGLVAPWGSGPEGGQEVKSTVAEAQARAVSSTEMTRREPL